MKTAAPPYLWALESSWLIVPHSSRLIFFFRLHYFGVVKAGMVVCVGALVESYNTFNISIND